VHGDVKGANILVNDHGEAALADFGLSSIIAVAGDATTSNFNSGSWRWMAPELLSQDMTSKTCASDTYSYGSVILEVGIWNFKSLLFNNDPVQIMTGEHPYNDLKNNVQVFNKLSQGITPKRPRMPILNPRVWDLMERCWSTAPLDRPKMSLVLSRMEKFSNEQRKSMPPIVRGRGSHHV
jgi:serine/threonine protein kinase